MYKSKEICREILLFFIYMHNFMYKFNLILHNTPFTGAVYANSRKHFVFTLNKYAHNPIYSVYKFKLRKKALPQNGRAETIIVFYIEDTRKVATNRTARIQVTIEISFTLPVHSFTSTNAIMPMPIPLEME